jgi:hypothetical protein
MSKTGLQSFALSQAINEEVSPMEDKKICCWPN